MMELLGKKKGRQRKRIWIFCQNVCNNIIIKIKIQNLHLQHSNCSGCWCRPLSSSSRAARIRRDYIFRPSQRATRFWGWQLGKTKDIRFWTTHTMIIIANTHRVWPVHKWPHPWTYSTCWCRQSTATMGIGWHMGNHQHTVCKWKGEKVLFKNLVYRTKHLIFHQATQKFADSI